MTDTPVRIIGMVDRGQPRILPETGSRQHADAALDANRPIIIPAASMRTRQYRLHYPDRMQIHASNKNPAFGGNPNKRIVMFHKSHQTVRQYRQAITIHF